MKRVLIISKYFYQSESIGSIRIQGLAKYLPKYGWDPTILTSDGPRSGQKGIISVLESKVDGTVPILSASTNMKMSNNAFLRYGLKWYKSLFWYPDLHHQWRKAGLRTAKHAVLADEYDAIISSALPVSSHIIASEVAKDTGIPWIADFRDLWTQNHYYPYLQARKIVERRLETKVLANASAFVTVSEPLAKTLSLIHRGRAIFPIPNGFDPEQINPGSPLTHEFSITYTGNLYRGRRDPSPLFKIIHTLTAQNAIPPGAIRVHFYGPPGPWLFDDVKKFGLENDVIIHGPVSRAVSIDKQRASHILLLLTWDNPEERGVYTGKLFDYLAARRPILSIGGQAGGVINTLLDETKAGAHVADQDGLKEYLVKAYREYNKDGSVMYRGIDAEIGKYSHIEMAKQFSDVLATVT